MEKYRYLYIGDYGGIRYVSESKSNLLKRLIPDIRNRPSRFLLQYTFTGYMTLGVF